MQSPPKLLFAPIKGITIKAYRNAFASHFGGFDAMYAPFISGAGVSKINPSKLQDVIPIAKNQLVTIPQLISTNAIEIKLLAETLVKHGHDHLNWNLGCPFPRLAEKYRGCGILPHPQMIDHILREVFSNGLPIQLSVKTRLGYHKPNETIPVLKVLNQYPLNSIIMHARTGKQIYSGDVDPDAFEHCLEYSRHPLVYNGDIYSHDRFLSFQARFPQVNTWMIGRGALMNPFLPSQIKGIHLTDHEKKCALKSFHDKLFASAMESTPHEKKGLGWLKAVWYYMSGVFSDGNEVFTRIKKSNCIQEYSDNIHFALEKSLATSEQQDQYFLHSIKHLGKIS